MLPAVNRLKKKKDFERVFKQGKGIREDFLYLKIVKNAFQSSRFGFVVSKKFSRKATERNKIKRRLSELIKLKLPGIQKNIDAVIVVMPRAEADFQKLGEVINKLFKKAKLNE